MERKVIQIDCQSDIIQYRMCQSYGDYEFSVAAPTLWNRLLADIRNASSLENLNPF